MQQASISGTMVLKGSILVLTWRVLRLQHSSTSLNRWINDPRNVSLSLFPDADAVGATHADVDVVITRNKRHVPTYGRVADVGSGNVKIHGRPGILTACRKFPSSQLWNGARRPALSPSPVFFSSFEINRGCNSLARRRGRERCNAFLVGYYSSARYGEFTVLLWRYEEKIKKVMGGRGFWFLAQRIALKWDTIRSLMNRS